MIGNIVVIPSSAKTDNVTTNLNASGEIQIKINNSTIEANSTNGVQIKEVIDSNFSNVVYSGKSLTTSGQDTQPVGISISSNGLKMFMIGTTNDKIYQYDLTTANDISTATYSGKSLIISGQNTNPFDMTISSNGLKIYMFSFNGFIYQYDLTTANDISTATYSGKSLNLNGQNINMRGISISSNGLKMFVNGMTTIYQYNLTTANDLSTATYSGKSLNVSGQDTNTLSLSISTNGLILFILGDNTNKIYKYNLTTANDISTATYSGKSLSVSAQGTYCLGLTLLDNFKIFFLDGTNTNIFEYVLVSSYILSSTGLRYNAN